MAKATDIETAGGDLARPTGTQAGFGRTAGAVRRVASGDPVIERLTCVWQRPGTAPTTEGAADGSSLSPRQRVPRKIAVMRAAAASVLLELALVYWCTGNSETWHTYPTGLGGFQRIALWDGSTVQLNTGSEMRRNFSAKDRRVCPHRGEANFKVTHNPARPFDVTAGEHRGQGGRHRVLGVAARQQTVDVLVTEGHVALPPFPTRRSTDCSTGTYARPWRNRDGECGGSERPTART